MLELRVSRSFVGTSTYDFLKQSVSQVMDIIAEGQKEGVIRADVDPYVMRHLVPGILSTWREVAAQGREVRPAGAL